MKKLTLFFVVAIGMAACADDGGGVTSGGGDIVSSASSSSHKMGQDCGSCHNGTKEVKFTVAGTLYSDGAGTQTVAGGTVTIANMGTLTSDVDGNFYSTESKYAGATGTDAITAPGGTMMATIDIDAGDGSCNSCHDGAAGELRVF